MNRFKGSITTLEAAINHLMDYLAEIDGVPRPLHLVEARVLVLVIAIGLAALGGTSPGLVSGALAPCIRAPRATSGGASECGAGRIAPCSDNARRAGLLLQRRARRVLAARRAAGFARPELLLPPSATSACWMSRSCREGSSTLLELVGVDVPKSMGQLLVAEAAEAVPDFRAKAPAPSDEGELLVLMPDAKGVNMVRPVEKAPPGSKLAPRPVERQGKKKMVAGDAWAIYTMNPELCCPPKPINRTTQAFLGTKREAFEMLAADAKRRGYGTKKTLFLADGDPDQWALQQEFFPDALVCLDIMHLLDHLWDAAHVSHPKGSKAAEAWIDARYELLMKDDAAVVISGLQASAKTATLSEAQGKTLASVITYMENNKDRMPYGTFMLAGHPIGTARSQGGVDPDRRPHGWTGMRWTEQGDEADVRICASSTSTARWPTSTSTASGENKSAAIWRGISVCGMIRRCTNFGDTHSGRRWSRRC